MICLSVDPLCGATTFVLRPVCILYNFAQKLSDGRHFKPVYGKDFVESLISSADQLASELEKTPEDRLSLQQNKSACLQGQIDLLRSHQASQDLRINCALAREAEESDGRMNERFVSISVLFWPRGCSISLV